MRTNKVFIPEVFFTNDCLTGEDVVKSTRVLGDLDGVFQDKEAYGKMNKEKVGQEYFMTKGHFHSNSDRAEFYWGVEGEGFLILMDERRNVWAERMFPGSLHYIPGKVAHRVANTGYQKLVFSACWPSDAGHDYATIADAGFARRLVDVNGVPTLV